MTKELSGFDAEYAEEQRLKQEVVDLLSDGISLVKICAKLRVGLRKVFNWLECDSKFKERYELAKFKRIEVVEDALYTQVTKGKTDAIIFYLCNRSPDRWRPILKVESKTDDEKVQRALNTLQSLLDDVRKSERPHTIPIQVAESNGTNGMADKNGSNGKGSETAQ